MQALIDFLMANLRALWPIARVYAWEQGLLVRCGHAKRELAPGIHWRWWFIDEVFRQVATEFTVELKPASITTRDGRAVALGANLSYRIVSIRKLWMNCAYFADSVKNLALGQLTTACLERDWAELVTGRDLLHAGLLAALKAAVAPWGVEITRLQLTHLVEAPAYQLLGDGVKVGA